MRPEETPTPEELWEAVRPRPMLVIRANDTVIYAHPEDNPSARAFLEKLSAEALVLELRDCGGFEKSGPLPWEMPRNDREITAGPGDLILFQGNTLALYYGENTRSLTRLARNFKFTGEELLEILGDGDVTVEISVEWSE